MPHDTPDPDRSSRAVALILAACAVALVVLLVVTACGNDDGGEMDHSPVVAQVR